MGADHKTNYEEKQNDYDRHTCRGMTVSKENVRMYEVYAGAGGKEAQKLKTVDRTHRWGHRSGSLTLSQSFAASPSLTSAWSQSLPKRRQRQTY